MIAYLSVLVAVARGGDVLYAELSKALVDRTDPLGQVEDLRVRLDHADSAPRCVQEMLVLRATNALWRTRAIEREAALWSAEFVPAPGVEMSEQTLSVVNTRMRFVMRGDNDRWASSAPWLREVCVTSAHWCANCRGLEPPALRKRVALSVNRRFLALDVLVPAETVVAQTDRSRLTSQGRAALREFAKCPTSGWAQAEFWHEWIQESVADENDACLAAALQAADLDVGWAIARVQRRRLL